MTKSENKSQDRRGDIIDASILAFAEHGYHNTTIQNIVDQTEQFNSVGTVFRYFPKAKNSVKDDILKAIFDAKITLLTNSVRERTQSENTGVQKIKAFLDHHFDHLQNNPKLAKVLQIELRQSHHFLRDYDHKKLEGYLGVLHEAIEFGKNSGEFKEDIPTTVIRWAIFGAIDEISTTWVLTEGKWPKDINGVSNHIISMFVDGLKRD